MTMSRRVTVAAVLCLLLNLPVLSTRTMAKGEGPGMFTSLYMLEPQFGRILEPLNSVTLADDMYMSGIQLGGVTDYDTPNANPPDMFESPDGKVLAIVNNSCTGCKSLHAKYLTIRIASLTRGMQLHSFHPQVTISPSYVSDDGKRIAGFGFGKNATTWYLLSTGRGKIVSATHISELCCDAALYDGPSGRLYVAGTTSAHTLAVGVYTTDNGSRVGQLTLDGVTAGTWQGNGGMAQIALPGVALSPDGKHLSVLDGSTNRLTIVDAPTMRVVSTQSISQPQTLLQRVGTFLGILPDTAFAKGQFMGTRLSMRYSRDGRSLFVTGFTGGMDASGHHSYRDIGLERIDATTAQLTGHALNGSSITWYGEAADASAVYTLTLADPTYAMCPCTLQAHDPTTLQTTAERTFSGYAMVHLFIVG